MDSRGAGRGKGNRGDGEEGGRNATGSGDRFRERRRGFSARSGARTWTRGEGMVVHGERMGVFLFSFSFFPGKKRTDRGVGSKG